MESPVRILFVDDEPNILRSLQRFFIEDDYEILTASSGREALDVLSAHDQIHVVVSDYRMPCMDGADLLRRVRENWPETIRVVLSGYADTAAMVSAINEGQIYRFIPKPWDETELRMTIASAIEQYRRQKREIRYADALQKRMDDLERENLFLAGKAAEAESSDYSREILDSLPVGVVMMDSEGRIVRQNPAAASLLRIGLESGSPGVPADRAPGELIDLLNASPSEHRSVQIRMGCHSVMVTATPMKGREDQFTVAVLWMEGPHV
jgi:two-component system NtrC family sensor kinase